MDRLVYYSVTLSERHPRPDLLWQLDTSLRTLRHHNRSVPVALFVHGDLPPALRSIAARHDVLVHAQGPYEDRLAGLCPQGWRALCEYPLLHKFLNFREIAAVDPAPAQVLFLDCDTVFFDDVDRLFDRYPWWHVVAREEVSCRRSAAGYDRGYLDEEALAALASAEGATPVPPFNLGVVLFNGRSWAPLADLDALLLDYAWRFVTWMAANPARGRAASYGESLAVAAFRGGAPGPDDEARALPFPSANRWLLDEVALWLTLGHVPGLTTGDFSAADVLQGGELATGGRAVPSAACAHYFSQTTDRVRAWLDRTGPPTAPDRKELVTWS